MNNEPISRAPPQPASRRPNPGWIVVMVLLSRAPRQSLGRPGKAVRSRAGTWSPRTGCRSSRTCQRPTTRHQWEPAWMQAGAQEVDRGLEQRRVNLDRSGQLGHRGVSRDEVPGTIEYDRGVGLVRGEDSIERLAHGRELWIRKGALGKCRSVAS